MKRPVFSALSRYFCIGMIFLWTYAASADFDTPLSPSDDTSTKALKPATKPQKATPKAAPSSPPRHTPHKKKEEGGDHNPDAPVYFEGDTAHVSRNQGELILVGHVVLKQDSTTLYSHEATLFAEPGGSFPSRTNRVQRAVAKGEVRIFKQPQVQGAGEIRAAGDEVEFLVPKRIVVLRGNAKVWRGPEYVHARIIELNLTTGEMKLEDPKGTVDPRNAAEQ